MMGAAAPDRALFKGYAIVSCGVMRPELEYLSRSGFVDEAADRNRRRFSRTL